MVKKTKKAKVEEEHHKHPHLIRDEEKSAVSIGLVFAIAYLLLAAFVTVSPDTAGTIATALTFGFVEINAKVPDTGYLLIGMITMGLLGIIGGFFYAKIYNMVKKS